MPAALPADWSGIAVMAAQGQTLQAISDATGIALGTLCARSQREGWKTPKDCPTEKKVALAVSNGQMQENAISALQTVKESLEDDSKASRVALSRGLRRVAEHVATLEPEVALAEAQNVKATVGSLSTVHGWEAKAQTALRVNIFADLRQIQADAQSIDV